MALRWWTKGHDSNDECTESQDLPDVVVCSVVETQTDQYNRIWPSHRITIKNGYHKPVDVVADSTIVSANGPCWYFQVQPGRTVPPYATWEATIPCAKYSDGHGVGALAPTTAGQIQVVAKGILRVRSIVQNYPMPTYTVGWS